jgi:hypothetical protein
MNTVPKILVCSLTTQNTRENEEIEISLARIRFRAGEGRAHWAAEAMATTEEKALQPLLLLTRQGGVAAAAGQQKGPQEGNTAAAMGDMAVTSDLRDALI